MYNVKLSIEQTDQAEVQIGPVEDRIDAAMDDSTWKLDWDAAPSTLEHLRVTGFLYKLSRAKKELEAGCLYKAMKQLSGAGLSELAAEMTHDSAVELGDGLAAEGDAYNAARFYRIAGEDGYAHDVLVAYGDLCDDPKDYFKAYEAAGEPQMALARHNQLSVDNLMLRTNTRKRHNMVSGVDELVNAAQEEGVAALHIESPKAETVTTSDEIYRDAFAGLAEEVEAEIAADCAKLPEGVAKIKGNVSYLKTGTDC